MSQLPLQNRQGYPFPSELDGQGMAELVRGKPSPDTGFGGKAAELGADGGA
jgi:hypothetical protein